VAIRYAGGEEMDLESAISRNILLAIIVSVAIIVVAVLVVLLMFPPQPDVVPQFSANIERSGNVVYIYHDGGDPLQEARTVVMVNGQRVPSGDITFLHSQDWPWTAGKTMRIQFAGPGEPEIVSVIYSSGSQEELVYTSSLVTPGTTPIPVTTITTAATTVPPVATTGVPVTTGAGIVPTASVPAGPMPPAADFTADPQAGQFPLTVQFTERSTGGIDSWLWNFGDGESSTLQNPAHTYQNPGTYTVTLTVTNAYGSGRKSSEAFISSGTVPAANLQAIPREGTAPLEVQFSDLSSGSPHSWEWSFGDETYSTDQNPIHTYYSPGTYTVTLTVSNQFGTNSKVLTNYVKVTSPEVVDVYLTGSQKGYLLPDCYLQFTVTGDSGSIKIGGTTYTFGDGDLVQLFPGDVDTAELDVNANGIQSFAFDDVRMFVNGELVRTGIVSGINVPAYKGLKSTFVIVIPPGESRMTLYLGGSKVVPGAGETVTIYNLREDSLGRLYLSTKIQAMSCRGGAESYSVK
jgi:PKD repeat protein